MKSAQEGLVAAQRQLAVLKAQRDTAEANLARATAQRDQAKLNLSYTEIRAPVDGMVAGRSVQVGNRDAVIADDVDAPGWVLLEADIDPYSFL